jgi:hypothetical protein
MPMSDLSLAGGKSANSMRSVIYRLRVSEEFEYGSVVANALSRNGADRKLLHQIEFNRSLLVVLRDQSPLDESRYNL